MSDGWIGVDLDGTLAEYTGWTGNPYEIGHPIPKMVARVKKWLEEGKQVWIFTARTAPEGRTEDEANHLEKVRETIDAWTLKHIGVALPVTYKKNYSMIELWDDRCVQVIPNTGERADGKR